MKCPALVWSFSLTACFLVAAVAGCRKENADSRSGPSEPPFFRDATEDCSLTFQHDAGPLNYFMPQSIGSGAALFDYDQDGRLDIYLLNNAGPHSSSVNRLFHQDADGRFRDVTAGSGLGIAGHGMGAAVGDINNDGWPDLLITQYGGARLFLNNGNGTFADVTRQAGLHLDLILWATAAAFVDYDRDGWLDLVIVHYVDYRPDHPCADGGGKPEFCPPRPFKGTVTKLYHNLGRSLSSAATTEAIVRFEDVTVRSGLGKRAGPGLGVMCADFNGDHWPDILVANDGTANHLWINQKNGMFKEEAVVRGLAYNADGQTVANMGVALGDVDNDGLFDIFISHVSEETHTLWKQRPSGQYRDQTVPCGLAQTHWRGTGFGTVMGDFDHDGALDVAVVNGRIIHGPPPPGVSAEALARLGEFWSQYAQRNQLFLNDGRGKYRDISPSEPAFCGIPGVYRGLACGDIDNDGALDLLVSSIAGPARLFLNVAPKRGHWLLMRVVDPQLKRDAYGAEVTVIAGERRWKRWVNPGYSFLSSNDPCIHFGLGQVERVDAIEVLWPDAQETRQVFRGCDADQAVELRKGQSKPLPLKRPRP